jgi:inosine-uridine nucleoside N-ribohydrolase
VAIDTDPGIDDAFALMLALRSPELHVELITTVAGNVPLEVATANARRLLALINPPRLPVLAQGAARPLRRPLHTATTAHGQDGLGGLTLLQRSDGQLAYPIPERPAAQSQAVRRLVLLAQKYGPALIIIALGPLTNIARAIQQAPESMRHLGRLVIMGGAIAVPGNVSPTAEFNIFVDPHAADVVFRAGLPITLVPLDVTRQVRLTEAFVQQTMQGGSTPYSEAIRHMTRQRPQRESSGRPMHDPLAVAVALDATLVTCTSLPLGVETRGTYTVGMTVADRRPARPCVPSLSQVDVALEVDAARVLTLLATRVLTA